jgi:hypothetical protein
MKRACLPSCKPTFDTLVELFQYATSTPIAKRFGLPNLKRLTPLLLAQVVLASLSLNVGG